MQTDSMPITKYGFCTKRTVLALKLKVHRLKLDVRTVETLLGVIEAMRIAVGLKTGTGYQSET